MPPKRLIHAMKRLHDVLFPIPDVAPEGEIYVYRCHASLIFHYRPSASRISTKNNEIKPDSG
jgi:hypothetical protein